MIQAVRPAIKRRKPVPRSVGSAGITGVARITRRRHPQKDTPDQDNAINHGCRTNIPKKIRGMNIPRQCIRYQLCKLYRFTSVPGWPAAYCRRVMMISGGLGLADVL